MRAYLIRRLFALIPTMLFATLIVFCAIRLIPGDIIDLMISQHDVSDEEVSRASIEKALGLDVPIYQQYARWMKDLVLHGDLGESLWQDTKVSEEIMARLPVTLELGAIALTIGLIIAIPVGVFSAIRQDTGVDYMGRSFAILLLAIPPFWMGTMIMVFPPIWWGWSASVILIPFTEDPLGHLQMYIVPSAVLAMTFSGITMRFLRTMMLEVMSQDYVRTAWAKGLKERVVIIRHVLKNALIPVITLIGLQLRGLIGGAVIIEQIFALPGLGSLTIESAFKRDYTIISGIMIFLAVFTLLLNLLVDLSYAWVDPRIRYK